MHRSLAGTMGIAVVALCMAAARGHDLGGEIDLTAFNDLEPTTDSSAWEGPHLEEVGLRDETAERRFYASAMIGPSFANVSSPVAGNETVFSSDTLFNAGGALGVAFERRHGRLRLEVEGMGRSEYVGLEANQFATTLLTSNWSAITNIWRDVMVTDRFGVYGGGGVGGGGYKLSESFEGESGGVVVATAPAKAAFAWQAGGGLLWEITDRLTFDAGYRFFQIDAIQQKPSFLPNQFAASEVMFSLRLYEPFRAWR